MFHIIHRSGSRVRDLTVSIDKSQCHQEPREVQNHRACPKCLSERSLITKTRAVFESTYGGKMSDFTGDEDVGP